MLENYINKLKQGGELYLKVKVRPGAAKTILKGVLEGEEEVLKIDISAPPEKGKANIELLRYLSKALAVDKGGIRIISGAGDKIKLLKITEKK